MIKVTAISKVSGRQVTRHYLPYQLLTEFIDESDIVEHMTVCNCQPIGETNVTDCNCGDEWEDFDLVLEMESDTL